MSKDHDPIRQANYLRQSLSQDKRPLGLFLGAGCPLSVRVGEDKKALVPDIDGLTTVVSELLQNSDACKRPFDKVCSHFSTDGKANPNIEDMLSHIRSLQTVAGSDTVRGLKSEDLDTLDRTICEHIVKLVNVSLPDRRTPYHNVAAWVGAIGRSFPVSIFTPSYDLLVEQALEHARVPFFDGFVGAHRPFFDAQAMEEDQLPSRWARLWKLHGSINWRLECSGSVSRCEPTSPEQRRVIHPSHLKYDESRRMPYLAMIDRLRHFLRQPNAILVICGYSFRDDHLNEVLIQGLQGNSSAMVFGLLYGRLSDFELAKGLAMVRSNLSLLAADAGVIGTRQARWLCRKEPADTFSNLGIDWVDEEGAAEGMKRAQFALGDFARFGEFLEDIIGTRTTVEGDQDVD